MYSNINNNTNSNLNNSFQSASNYYNFKKYKDVDKISILVDCLMFCWYDDVKENNSPSISPKNPPLNTNNSAFLTTLLNSLCRSVESFIVEAVLEYCRIVYDLFYSTKSVVVFTTYQSLPQFNTREQTQQSLKLIAENFTRVNIKDTLEGNNDSNNSSYQNSDFFKYLDDLVLSHYKDSSSQKQDSPQSPAQQTSPPTQQPKFKKDLKTLQEEQKVEKQKNIIILVIQGGQEGLDLLKYKTNNKIIEIGHEINQLVAKYNRALQGEEDEKKFELIILKITNSPQRDKIQQNQRFLYKKYSDHLDCIVKEFDVTLLFNAISDLAYLQFNLSSVLVKGIPMKEMSTRSSYDVALLYPTSSSANNKFNKHIFPRRGDNMQKIPRDSEEFYKKYYSQISSLEIRSRNEIIVKWKTNEKNTNQEVLATTCSHRVTPFLVSSSPSTCLMKFLCSGKSVFLVTPPNEDIYTHVLTLHEREVYLHCLHRPIKLQGLGPILEHYANEAVHYRIRGFQELVDNSMILSRNHNFKSSSTSTNGSPTGSEAEQQSTNSFQNIALQNPFFDVGLSDLVVSTTTLLNSQSIIDEISLIPKINIVASKIAEKYTRYFPWTEGETLLFSLEHEELNKSLMQIKKLLLKDTLSPELLDQFTKNINTLYSLTQSNDPILFPNLKGTAAARKDLYRKLWLELYNFFRICQISQNHTDIFNVIEKIVLQMQIIQQPLQPVILPYQQQQNQQQQQQQQQPQNQNSPSHPQQQQPTPKTTPTKPMVQSQAGLLYQNLLQQQQSQNQTQNTGDLWKQFSKGKKQAKDDELRAERDRQMKNTNPQGMPVGYDYNDQYNQQNPKKRKHPVTFSNSTAPKQNNFFSNYWEQKQNNLQPQELSGRQN
ncbi:hypothetical protein DICPUDRAFT_96739 [Dictyostelium purpureum]|uniref:Protein asunder n=1 Tax=Dictyostelium purpureum TaxID=5786 RepID=F0ZAU5_DICPU|nr:uncharacterized protein DICPUDRAFT_96739 [Dictyostelium purpureum]EGC38949.1 hypothetical protein DICPUDRAFT_96739 [Dictyostelium purpureum]|eukprot:XP_003284514.1 hypothetical protein DICPUDRAFT_96739 [Dictyostelium purpureum]